MKKLNSLRWKLLIGIILIIAITVTVIVILVSRTTTREFDKYISQDKALKYQRLSLLLSSYYEETGSWSGVQRLINRIKKAYAGRIVLANPEGTIIADSEDKLLGKYLEEGWSMKVATIRKDETPVGSLFLKREKRSTIEKAFLNSVNRSVILASLIAGFGCLLFTYFYSTKILDPVKKLTEAAERIKQGNLDQTVEVYTGDEIGKLANTFNSMAEKLEEKERLRKNVVSDVAHELRSPLSKSHAYLEAIKNGDMEPKPEIIDTIYRNSCAINELVDNLHDLSKAEAGQLQLDKKIVVLEDLINRTIDRLEEDLEEKNVDLSIYSPDEIVLNVDPERLGQVFRNIIDNAISNFEEGGKIDIKAKEKAEVAEVRISDNGPGIPASDLPHIFERFYRVDKSRSKSTGGSGLGLTISKEIIEAHGGEIEVKSEEGKGTTFILKIPTS